MRRIGLPIPAAETRVPTQLAHRGRPTTPRPVRLPLGPLDGLPLSAAKTRIEAAGFGRINRVEPFGHFGGLKLRHVFGQRRGIQLAPGDPQPAGEGISGLEDWVWNRYGGFHTEGI